MLKKLHTPIFVSEILRIIEPINGMKIIDMTFGSGGHTKALLKKCPDLEIYALDRDPVAYEEACALSKIWPQIKPIHGKFSQIKELISEIYFAKKIDAVLMDLGTSAMQLDNPQRGFSFKNEARLDMRMDNSKSNIDVSAFEVVNGMCEADLAHILKTLDDENNADKIAQLIEFHRKEVGSISTTTQLANIVKQAYASEEVSPTRRDALNRRQHVATRTFQALRIFVNDELAELDAGLGHAHDLLRSSGICVAISFHSLEEQIVKRHFNVGRKNKVRRLTDISSRHLARKELLKNLKVENVCESYDSYEDRKTEDSIVFMSDSSDSEFDGCNKQNDAKEYNSLNDANISDYKDSNNLDCSVDMACNEDEYHNDRNNRIGADMTRSWKQVISKAIAPTDREIAINPRCKSARLRAAIKCS